MDGCLARGALGPARLLVAALAGLRQRSTVTINLLTVTGNAALAPRIRLADMEGPAVKWFVTASSISWSMLTSEYCSGGGGRIPEDAGARLTMERLRRRIRLICADCSEEQSRMTPLRRELPPSRGASRPDPETGRRIASARTLQSCSHRAGADVARECRSHYPRPLLVSATIVTRRRAGSRVESWRPR
jgi:hypothetical protein